MSKKLFYTTVLTENNYVRGKISGIAACLCEPKRLRAMKSHANLSIDGHFCIVSETSRLAYHRFKRITKKVYPGICQFNVKIK